MLRTSRGQQEMVGFILIVVIVVIGLLVFLLFSMRPGEVKENDIANNLLSAILKTSSDCAIVYEPNYDDMRDLFRSCYDYDNGFGGKCSNTQEDPCYTLETALTSILDEVLVLEPIIEAYQLDFSHSDSVGFENYLHLIKGNCTGNVYGYEPQTIRISSSENLIVTLRICMPADL